MNLVRLRILAVVIDVALLAGAAYLCKKILLLLWPLSEGAGSEYPWILLPLTSFGYLLLAFLLYGFCGGILRASPGKRILKLKLSPIDGQPVSFMRAMLREQMRVGELVFFISGFFSLLNLLESRPTTTDTVFRTYVQDMRR
jgi:uncharacterized RDD family membrane protein YckC